MTACNFFFFFFFLFFFPCFPCVYKQMLRLFPRQVATTCFSCSPPDLNLVVTNFMFCLHVKEPLPPGNNPIAVNKYIIIFFFFHGATTLLQSWPSQQYPSTALQLCYSLGPLNNILPVKAVLYCSAHFTTSSSSAHS